MRTIVGYENNYVLHLYFIDVPIAIFSKSMPENFLLISDILFCRTIIN